MQQVQVITGVERRRRFSDSDKARILAETLEPGATVVGVARRHEISASLIHCWRKVARKPSDFVQLLPEAGAAEQAEPPVIRVHVDGEIVIDFPCQVEPRHLVAILRALKS